MCVLPSRKAPGQPLRYRRQRSVSARIRPAGCRVTAPKRSPVTRAISWSGDDLTTPRWLSRFAASQAKGGASRAPDGPLRRPADPGPLSPAAPTVLGADTCGSSAPGHLDTYCAQSYSDGRDLVPRGPARSACAVEDQAYAASPRQPHPQPNAASNAARGTRRQAADRPHPVGHVALGFTLTIVSIRLAPVAVDAAGWRYALLPLAAVPVVAGRTYYSTYFLDYIALFR